MEHAQRGQNRKRWMEKENEKSCVYLLTICAVYANIYVATAHGGVAQLGERTVRIRKVESSILFVSTKPRRSLDFFRASSFYARTDEMAKERHP